MYKRDRTAAILRITITVRERRMRGQRPLVPKDYTRTSSRSAAETAMGYAMTKH